MINWKESLILENENVRLIPLEKSHRAALLEAAKDGELWNLWFTSVPSESTIDAYIESALNQEAAQKSIPFVIINTVNNQIIGSTRFCSIDENNRRLEIGYTWYAQSFQRTGINTNCKYLLLQYAFENLNCIAVEFKTHFFNYRSRTAIAKLGARQDGILRNHRIGSNSIIRDTVIFSIIESEWKAVKRNLEFRLSKGASKK